MNLGENIKKARNKKRLTQKQLALELNVTPITIQNYENNRRKPSIDTIGKIAEILDVDFFELINNIEIEVNTPVTPEFERQEKIDSIVLSVEKHIAIKKWVKNTGLDEIFQNVLDNNIDLQNLRNNIEILGNYERDEFKRINDIPLDSFNMESNVISSKYQSTYIENIKNKILLILNLEETKLLNIIKNNPHK